MLADLAAAAGESAGGAAEASAWAVAGATSLAQSCLQAQAGLSNTCGLVRAAYSDLCHDSSFVRRGGGCGAGRGGAGTWRHFSMQ